MDKPIEKKLTHCPIAWLAQENPLLIAIEMDQQRINFAELDQRISAISLQLLQLNMKKGDRLACVADNGLPLILLQFACLRHAFIFCPINAKFSSSEIEQRLNILNTAFVWQENKQQSLFLDFESYAQQVENPQPIEIDPLSVISIIFTSGSSGLPKAVMHNFCNHYYSALGSQSIIALEIGDKNLLSLPLFHISGYATVMRTMLAGATLQLFKNKMTSEQLRKAGTTHLSLVNSQLIKLVSEPTFHFHSLKIKHLLLGGSTFASDLLDKTERRGFTYHLSYGSTEMASQIATSTNDQALKLLPYREIKILNKEILLAGETRFVGYFPGKIMEQSDYFSSTDLGELNGNTIKIIGRKDRQFISGGENIQPEEIEKVLLAFTGVSQAYVLPINDPTYGQRPIAFIKWNNGDQSALLQAFVKEKLIAFKRPLHYLTLPTQQGIKPNPKQLTNIALKLLLVN